MLTSDPRPAAAHLARHAALVLVASLCLLASACGRSGSDDALAPRTPPPSPTATTDTATATATATATDPVGPRTPTPVGATPTPVDPTPTPVGATACSAGPTAIPAGAVSAPVVDLDGDGRGDTLWIVTEASGETLVGVVTAAGGGTQRTFRSASPVTRGVLPLLINDATPPVLLADDGRTVQLWAFHDCAIVDVANAQGDPYEFSLGFSDIGTGVGCRLVDGVNQLVGLDAKPEGSSTVAWTSTVVTVTGTSAVNGAITSGTYVSPTDDADIALLHEVTCGDRTIADDGVTASN